MKLAIEESVLRQALNYLETAAFRDSDRDEAITALRETLDTAEKVEPTGFLRTLVQIHPDGTETWKEEPFYTRPTSSILAKVGADKTGEVKQDLNKCPSCGGPADNGFSREIPPSPYYCTKCMEKLK